MAANQTEIADRLGVSQRAVSFALNGKPGVSPKTRQRILALAAELGYRPSSAARAMRSSRTGQIGVLMYDAGVERSARNHTFEFVVGVNSVLEPSGYVMSLVQLTDVEANPFGVKRVFAEQRLDGMIVLASLVEPVRRRIGELIERCVWCDAGVREPQGCLWRDEVEAGRLAARAAVGLGYRRVVFVVELPPDPQRQYRHDALRGQGVREVAAAAGVPVEEVVVPVPDRPTTAAEQARVLGRLAPDVAVIASSYAQAPVVAHAAASAGLLAPRDYGLLCCDDSDELGRMFPQLSRATFDRFGMGRRAARMMIRRLSDPAADVPSHVDRPRWHPGCTAWGPGAGP